jgi:xylulokinase
VGCLNFDVKDKKENDFPVSFIGVDIGTSGCKAISLGENGAILAEAEGQYDLLTPQPGWAELDPNQVFSVVKSVIGKVAQVATSDPVSAMAVSSMGDTIVPCDGRGKPMENSILAFDTRNILEADQFKEELGAEWIFSVTGQPVHPSYSIVKIKWIRDHMPELFDEAVKYLCFEDFITCQLCGEAVISHSSAARTMAFDIHEKVWDEDLLGMAGIGQENMAKPVLSGERITKIKSTLAEELNISPDVVVVSGGHDQPCGSLGSGYFNEGYATDSTGTVEVLLVTCSEPILTDEMLNANICFWPHVVNGKFCTCGQILTAGAAFRWFRDEMTAGEGYDAIIRQFSELPTELLFIPHLAGSGTPEFYPTAKGAFFGATLKTNKYEVAKSIIEGVCFELKINMDLLEKAGIVLKGLRAFGGAAQSETWMQLKADISGMPIEACKFVNQCPLGAAFLAAEGVGFFNSPEESIDFVTHDTMLYIPDKNNRAIYKQKFEKYIRFRSAVSDLYK